MSAPLGKVGGGERGSAVAKPQVCLLVFDLGVACKNAGGSMR